MGIVYLLTNASMPGLVKIGMTDDADASARIAQLYSTGVPLPFEIAYACRVDKPGDVERALHTAFGPHRINQRREFFRIDPEQAMAILRLLDQPDATEELQNQPSGVDEVSLAAVQQEKARRPNFNFREMGIQNGSELIAWNESGLRLVVVGEKKVKLGDEELSLSAATQQAFSLNYAVRPGSYWKYQGRLLSDIYDETYSDVQ